MINTESLCFILGKIAEADPEEPILIFRTNGPPACIEVMEGLERQEIIDLCDRNRQNLVGAFSSTSPIGVIFQKLNIKLSEALSHERLH